MKKLLASLLALLCVSVVASAADASVYSYQYDAAPALILQNNDTTSNIVVTITNAADGTVTIRIHGVTTAIDCSGTTDTIAEFAAALEAATNASTYITVDQYCSLAADLMKGKLLDGTYTAAAGAAVVIPWDTSAALHYDTYIPQGFNKGKFTLAKIAGEITGTGDVTLTVYDGRTIVWGPKTYTSPTYVTPASWVDAGSTNAPVTNSNIVNNRVWVNEEVGLKVDNRASRLLVRATRGTTATTGNLAAYVEAR